MEITYGMERILMNLQGVTNFRDIRYNDRVSYGELFLQVWGWGLVPVTSGWCSDLTTLIHPPALQNEYEMRCYSLAPRP